MDHRAVPPGNARRRYQQIVGGDTGELTLYLARRLLTYGADEWRALPWWQRRAYTNGMTWELEQGGIFPPQGQPGAGGQEAPGAHTEYTPFTSMADRAASGITVIG